MDFKHKGGVSVKSKKHYLSVLSLILELAKDDNVIALNPARAVKLPVYKKAKIMPFSSKEVRLILKFSKKYSENFQIFLIIGFYTGMRTGEILALKLKDIDLKQRLIHIKATRSRFGENAPKTEASCRSVAIFDTLYPHLCKFIKARKNNVYLLQTQYKKSYKDDNVFTQKYYKTILKELKIPYRRLYTMRHTFATNCLLANALSPLELSQILGHSSCEMIYKVYVRYVEDMG